MDGGMVEDLHCEGDDPKTMEAGEEYNRRSAQDGDGWLWLSAQMLGSGVVGNGGLRVMSSVCEVFTSASPCAATQPLRSAM